MGIGNKLAVVKTAATSKAGLSLLRTQKHAPAFLFAAGVVGFGATVYLASKATLQVGDILEENERRQADAQDTHEVARLEDSKQADREFKKETAAIKLVLIKDVARLYAPAVAVGVMSVGALTGSHVILNRRYTGVVAAYATLDKSFREYRGRVSELYGSDVDKKLVNGVAVREVASEDGSSVSTVYESEGRSPYAKRFAKDTSHEWSPQADYNLAYLRGQQTYANDMLKANGHIFLSDIYKALGFDETPASRVVGWVKDNPNGGDGVVDFGIFENPNRFHDFMAGRSGEIWLDFNVDGVVYDLI